MPAQATQKTEAELIEIFSSIQGEGLLVGHRQVFVRMARCNLSCAYCDTLYEPQERCRIESQPGSNRFDSIPNPVTLDVLSSTVRRWLDTLPGAHHSLSVTGGEPLMQVEVLREWLPVLREWLPIYLETNGTMPAALQQLLPSVDWISMDLKFPSQTGLEPQWDAHEEFLALARVKNCLVKAVVGPDTTAEELLVAARLMKRTASDVPLILQPVTTTDHTTIPAGQLLEMQALVAAIHPFVRVIPQLHHFLAVL